MKFRYIGKNEEMTAYGYDFSGGKEPDVTNEAAIKRLSGNRFFEAVEEEGGEDNTDPGKKKPGRKPKAEAEQP